MQALIIAQQNRSAHSRGAVPAWNAKRTDAKMDNAWVSMGS